jgi:hypothetical protein
MSVQFAHAVHAWLAPHWQAAHWQARPEPTTAMPPRCCMSLPLMACLGIAAPTGSPASAGGAQHWLLHEALLSNLCTADAAWYCLLQEAVKHQQYDRLRDSQGRPAGMLGWAPERSVTFADNHDTGSTQQVGGWGESAQQAGYGRGQSPPPKGAREKGLGGTKRFTVGVIGCQALSSGAAAPPRSVG